MTFSPPLAGRSYVGQGGSRAKSLTEQGLLGAVVIGSGVVDDPEPSTIVHSNRLRRVRLSRRWSAENEMFDRRYERFLLNEELGNSPEWLARLYLNNDLRVVSSRLRLPRRQLIGQAVFG